MDGSYGVVPAFVDPPQFDITNDFPLPPVAYRRPCHWAQLHAGIQHIVPAWERNALIWRSRGVSIRALADGYGVSAPEVRAAIGRVERTLATWEREQDRYANRYPLREPAALWPDGATERERVRDSSSGFAPPAQKRGTKRKGHRAGHMGRI